MIAKESIKTKLKTLAAGVTLMAGVALGTGCEGSQQINKTPTEDIVNDNDEINDKDTKPIENDDSGEVVENNDTDEQPINNNDSDDIIENNDKDEQPIENNDNDSIENNDNDTIENNDGDTIENNDGDNNDPTENDDSDNTPGYYYVTNDFTPEDMVMTKEELETTPQEDIDTQLFGTHDKARLRCPYNYSKNPEIYDEQGNVYVVDSCKGNLTNTKMWFENIFPQVYSDIYNLTPPASHRITYMNVDYSKAGSPSNVTIRLQNMVIDVDFLSFNCLSQATEDTSVITSTPSWKDGRCITDGNEIGFPKTQSIKQTKKVADDYISLCKTMPNYQFDEESGTCYTTIEEFVWLEKVPHKLLNQNGFSWKKFPYGIDRIERHLDTNKFYMDMTIGYNTSSDMKVHIELNNAKSCIDQCYGKTGCTSRIEPNPDASQGCFINGEEAAHNVKMKNHNLKHKTAPRFIKPAPAVAKQYYANNLKPNRQKWLAQNVRNFGHNGR